MPFEWDFWFRLIQKNPQFWLYRSNNLYLVDCEFSWLPYILCIIYVWFKTIYIIYIKIYNIIYMILYFLFFNFLPRQVYTRPLNRVSLQQIMRVFFLWSDLIFAKIWILFVWASESWASVWFRFARWHSPPFSRARRDHKTAKSAKFCKLLTKSMIDKFIENYS